LIAFGYWKREGVRTGNTFTVEPEPKFIPLLNVARSSTSCAPLQLSKMKNSSAFRDNVTSPGKDCCPIVDSFEKNFSRKKDVLQVKHDRGNAKG
jgi:hypothetical protein